MKIGHLENNGAAATQVATERKASAGQPSATPTAAGAAGGTGSAEPSAQVALSSTLTQLGSAGAQGDFDSEKVQRIAQAIRDGKFTVNPEAIADKLIANAQELLNRGTH